MSLEQRRVLIAGGGPVGLLSALLLGRQGLPVRLFDVNESPQADPRAATTHPATLDLLAQDGLADDMARVGLVAPIFQFWDRPSGEKIAEFDHAVLKADTRHPFVVQCEQFKTAKLILERLSKLPNVEVLFGHEVVDVTQTNASINVDVRGPDGVRTHSGAYLIGADGGRSVVRKQSDIAFDGFTWPERFIVLTTPFNFEAHADCVSATTSPTPTNGAIASRCRPMARPALWRTVFPANPKLSDGELMSDAAVQERMQKFFPASQPL